MNVTQSERAAPVLREAGAVELLTPLLTNDYYQVDGEYHPPKL